MINGVREIRKAQTTESADMNRKCGDDHMLDEHRIGENMG